MNPYAKKAKTKHRTKVKPKQEQSISHKERDIQNQEIEDHINQSVKDIPAQQLDKHISTPIEELADIQKQLEGIDDRLRANKRIESNSLIAITIGALVRNHMADIVESVVDDMLLEAVDILNVKEESRNALVNKEYVIRLTNQLLEDLSYSRVSMNNKTNIACESLNDSVQVSQTIETPIVKDTPRQLQLENGFIIRIKKSQELRNEKMKLINYLSPSFVIATRKASELMLDDIFENIFEELLKAQYEFLNAIVQHASKVN